MDVGLCAVPCTAGGFCIAAGLGVCSATGLSVRSTAWMSVCMACSGPGRAVLTVLAQIAVVLSFVGCLGVAVFGTKD